MPKIPRKLLTEFTKSKQLYSKNKKEIISLFEDTISNKYDRHIWRISDVEVCYDEDMKNIPIEYEWIEISEDEYEYDIKNFRINADNWKVEYEYDPEFKERYFRYQQKKYEYLRVWVHEAWGCSGHDDVYYDFLLTDILELKDLRKEKLEKLERI